MLPIGVAARMTAWIDPSQDSSPSVLTSTLLDPFRTLTLALSNTLHQCPAELTRARYTFYLPCLVWRVLHDRWGSPQFIGIGFLSFISIILTELFGSPFLKNISIIVGLAVGCIVSGAAGYIDGSSITTAPAITFLWLVFTHIEILLLGMLMCMSNQGTHVQDWGISPSNIAYACGLQYVFYPLHSLLYESSAYTDLILSLTGYGSDGRYHCIC